MEDNIAAELKRMNDYLLDFRSEVIRRFDLIDTRLEILEAIGRSHDVLPAGLSKAVTNFGGVASQLMKADTELKRRIEALEKPAA
jgi:hypothetical protein